MVKILAKIDTNFSDRREGLGNTLDIKYFDEFPDNILLEFKYTEREDDDFIIEVSTQELVSAIMKALSHPEEV